MYEVDLAKWELPQPLSEDTRADVMLYVYSQKSHDRDLLLFMFL